MVSLVQFDFGQETGPRLESHPWHRISARVARGAKNPSENHRSTLHVLKHFNKRRRGLGRTGVDLGLGLFFWLTLASWHERTHPLRPLKVLLASSKTTCHDFHGVASTSFYSSLANLPWSDQPTWRGRMSWAAGDPLGRCLPLWNCPNGHGKGRRAVLFGA